MAVLLAIAVGWGLAAPSAVAQSNSKAERDAGRIFIFLVDTYLSGDDLTARELRAMYAPQLTRYWKRRNVAVSTVIRDKLNYFERWPVRSFRLIEETLAISRTRDDSVYAVSFEYGYRTERGQAKVAEGFGETELEVYVEDGEVLVLSETGRVIQRF